MSGITACPECGGPCVVGVGDMDPNWRRCAFCRLAFYVFNGRCYDREAYERAKMVAVAIGAGIGAGA